MKLISLLAAVILCLVVTSVTAANRTADSSLRLTEVESEVQALEQEVAILKSQVDEASSLTSLESRATAAGYIEPRTIAAVALPALTASR